jgi:tetratricopeptide (TPR) repeat protein
MPERSAAYLVTRNSLIASVLGLALFSQPVLLSLAVGFLPQDIAGGISAFRGQDIMGGAAIVFKRPQRLRDLVGGASMLVVKRQPRPARTTDIARNNPPDRRRPPRETGTTAARVSEEDKGEAFKNQGNTYYDLGQFAEAITAYQNAL